MNINRSPRTDHEKQAARNTITLVLIAIVATILAIFIATSASAQNNDATSNSGSSSAVNAANDANASVTFNTPAETRSIVQSRHSEDVQSTIRAAPPVSPPSMSSGHPCAVASSAGISIIGAGIAGGGGKIDDACLLGQMGLTKSAVAMIAARNPDACKALRAAGRIAASSLCTNDEKRAAQARPVAASATAPRANPVADNVRCERIEGRLTARVRAGSGVSNEAAAAYCRGS